MWIIVWGFLPSNLFAGLGSSTKGWSWMLEESGFSHLSNCCPLSWLLKWTLLDTYFNTCIFRGRRKHKVLSSRWHCFITQKLKIFPCNTRPKIFCQTRSTLEDPGANPTQQACSFVKGNDKILEVALIVTRRLISHLRQKRMLRFCNMPANITWLTTNISLTGIYLYQHIEPTIICFEKTSWHALMRHIQ